MSFQGQARLVAFGRLERLSPRNDAALPPLQWDLAAAAAGSNSSLSFSFHFRSFTPSEFPLQSLADPTKEDGLTNAMD